jgi:TolB protein
MKTFFALLVLGFLAVLVPAGAQQSDIKVILTGDNQPVIALPDLRGAGEAQAHMEAFNRKLYEEIESSSVLKIAAKSTYPLQIPQRPQDLRPGGAQLADWSRPPVGANYVAFGYTAVQDGRLVLFGYLFDATQQNLQGAQVIGKLYFGDLSADGARKVAQEFAADILARFGAQSLAGTKIYFVREVQRGYKEIWAMDHDGGNQRQVTKFGELAFMPAVSGDGTKLAFTLLSQKNPSIVMWSVEANRRLPFVNPQASVNSSPNFAPDGRSILFSSSLGGGFANIFAAGTDGSGIRRITSVRAVETEPKINPKTGQEVVMTSGRSGTPQIYKMSIDGTGIERLTSGEGDAVNPSWHPGGELIAFAWTRGFEPGNFNIFVMDVNTRNLLQLTHGVGRNENPTWAPDGRHIVFSSTRDGTPQIYSMLADGTKVKKLTGQGRNTMPVWSK